MPIVFSRILCKRTASARSIYLTVFITGSSVLVIEITGTRVLAPFYGSTIYVWASLISVTLAALALGYYCGGRLIDRHPLLAAFYATVAAAGISLFALMTSSNALFHATAPLGIRFGPLAATSLLFSPPLFFLGMLSPMAVKLQTRSLDDVGGTAGGLYAVATAGSLAGAMFAGFFLAPNYSSTAILFALAGFLVLWGAGGTALVFAGARSLKRAAAALAAGAVVFSSGWGFLVLSRQTSVETSALYNKGKASRTAEVEADIGGDVLSASTSSSGASADDGSEDGNDEYSEHAGGTLLLGSTSASARSAAPAAVSLGAPTAALDEDGMPLHPAIFTSTGTNEARIIYDEPTAYGQVRVFDAGGADKNRCVLIDGAIESCWAFKTSNVSDYVQSMQGILGQMPDTKDVLVIGVGGGTFLKALDGSGLSVDAVEINGAFTEVIRDYFVAPKILDLELYIDDGRHFLNQTGKKYDAIILDICEVNQNTFHLWTKEFYALALEHLKDSKNGYLIASMNVAAMSADSELLEEMAANALGSVFENVYGVERFGRKPNDYDIRVFMARNLHAPLEKAGYRKVAAWEHDASVPALTDLKLGRALELSLPAYEAIRRELQENYGEELFLPRR